MFFCFFFFLGYYKSYNLLQKFTGDTSKPHNIKSVEIFEEYLKTFATEIFEIFNKDLTSF